MTPGATRRLERFFQVAAKAAEAEIRIVGPYGDPAEVADRALADADAQVHLTRDERTRAHSALARWQSADVPASELPGIFRTVAELFASAASARRAAELEASSAEHRATMRAGRISAAQRVAPTIH